MEKYLTIGQVAEHFGCTAWMVRRTISRGFYAEPPRVGSYRTFTEADLPGLRDALVKAGYIEDSSSQQE